jgi:hypothetical protein
VTPALDPLDWLDARGLKILNITVDFGLTDGGKKKLKQEENRMIRHSTLNVFCFVF